MSVDNWFADKPFYIHPDGNSWYVYCHCGCKFGAWIHVAPEAFIAKFRVLLSQHLACVDASPDAELQPQNPAPDMPKAQE